MWREKLFAWMLRNAASAMEFFRLPTNRVVELGSQVEIRIDGEDGESVGEGPFGFERIVKTGRAVVQDRAAIALHGIASELGMGRLEQRRDPGAVGG
jgi:hypothetical protein